MTDRIVEVAEEPAALSVRHEQLVIKTDSGETTVPLCDIAVLVIAHPRASYTHSVLTGLVEAGGVCVLSGADYLPAAMTLPLHANSEQAERFRLQAAAAVPLRKRAWQQVVRAKLRSQARALAGIGKNGLLVAALEKEVGSGDPANVEAQAARRYWRELFGEGFRRDRQAPDQNRHLNYGYAVLRAVTARAVCAAGLHPSFGLHHSNRYNAFALADDLMEPYRARVDRAVAGWLQTAGAADELTQSARRHLMSSVTAAGSWEGEERSLFDWMSKAALSWVGCLKGERKELLLPEL